MATTTSDPDEHERRTNTRSRREHVPPHSSPRVANSRSNNASKRRMSELVEKTIFDLNNDDVDDESNEDDEEDGGAVGGVEGDSSRLEVVGVGAEHQQSVSDSAQCDQNDIQRCRDFLGYETMDNEHRPVADGHQDQSDATAAAAAALTTRQSILMETATRSKRTKKRRTSSIHHTDPFGISYRPGRFTLYSPPCQRQRWGQTQILPRVDFGDMFFDLFYVGSTYNASNILVDQPSRIGLLYFLGSFLSIMQLWINKTLFDARFVVSGEDLYHRLWEIAHLILVSNAIVHIQPVGVMSKTSEFVDTFAFCISIALIQFLLITKYIELYFVGRGQRDVIKKVSIRDGTMLAVGMILHICAAVIAGLDYYGTTDRQSEGSRRILAIDDSAAEYTTTSNSSTNSEISSGYSPSDDPETTNSIPIWLCLFVPVLYWLSFFIRTVFLWPRDGYSHKKFLVPINVSFTIHRDGEWTMLMYGECILSLLIEDSPQEDGSYYWTFYLSLMTVIMLQYLHFRSQPHDADDHVLRRSKDRGLVWQIFLFVYASSLIALGSSFTLLVRSSSADEASRAREDDNASGRYRSLATGESTMYPLLEMRRRGTYIFAISLALVFLSLDVMSLTHVGFKHSRRRCYCKESKWYNKIGIALVVARVGLIGLTGSLAWIIDGNSDDDVFALTGTGFAITLVQLGMRHLGETFLSEADKH